MKRRILKCIALMLALILAIPILPAGNVYTASAAAKPVLSSTKKTVIGINANFSLNVKNVAGSNVKKTVWYSKNENVVSVEATKDPLTGKVTTVGKGTADARCKVTYKNGKSIFLSCRVTVKIPATAVGISNRKDTENGRQIIAVGETYDFNRSITPKNASDKTYWVIDEKGKQYATVDKNGIVKGVKPGFVTMKAVAAMTPQGAAASVINDAINIEIVDKTMNVLKVNLVDSTKLAITFDRAVNSSTVIGTGDKLLDSVVIASKIDSKGVSATPLGNLKGSLSSDGKTLTITATNAFNGTYGLLLSSSIKSTDNIALKTYNENLELYDNSKPYFVNSTVDDTGLIAYLNFSEPMNFNNLQVTSARLISSGTAVDSITLAMLNTRANYTKSEDNKSLIIDLSTMPVNDRNKKFQISISGVTDLSGNSPASVPIVAYLQTDTSSKSQARLINLERTGYNTLTATFSRAISYGGYVTLSNGDFIFGNVDATDPKKVNYTLSDASAVLNGRQEVSISGWDSYNVNPNDDTASKVTKRTVNFTLDNTLPVLTNSLLEVFTENGIDSYVLTLTYNKNITLVSGTGSLSAKIVTTDNDIIPGRILYYTGISKDAKVTLILDKTQLTESGVYTITIPEDFVRDTYGNKNAARIISVQKTASVASNLSAPRAIVQDSDNPSVINVYFDRKLDMASAQNVNNYSITGTGTTVISAELTENSPTGATVKLTLNPGCLTASTLYPITISGIRGYQDSYSEMEKYQQLISLKENKAPQITGIKYIYPLVIEVSFDEVITGTASFQVIQGSSDLYSLASISGNKIIINLKTTPTLNSNMLLSPNLNNVITDLCGNKVEMQASNVYAKIN